MRACYTPDASALLGILLVAVDVMNVLLYPLVLQQSESLKFRFHLFESRIEATGTKTQTVPVEYRWESSTAEPASLAQDGALEVQANDQAKTPADSRLNWRAQRAHQRVQNLRPIDWQLARITRFERTTLQKRQNLFDGARPLRVDTAQAYLDWFRVQFGFGAEIALLETSLDHPWAMPIGARPAIHMRPIDRQPYLLAHEFAHIFTRKTNHGVSFVRAYLDALVLLGVNRADLETELRRHGIAF